MSNLNYFDRQDKVIGSNNSKKLTNSKVLVIGCGGLGTPIIEYLFRAGVNICVIDFDKVDVSNIHRQLFYERNIGELKSESIYNRLNNLTNLHNSKIEYKTIKIDNSFLDDEKNILFLKEFDLIIDAVDSYESKLVLQNICSKLSLNLLFSSVSSQLGMVSLIQGKHIEKLTFFYENKTPKNPTKTGVLGTCSGIIGTITGHIALKYFIDDFSDLNKLFYFDMNTMQLKKINL